MKRDKRQSQSPSRGRDGRGARRPQRLLRVARPSPFMLLALGRTLFGPREGLAAGALLALAGFQVYYAQECRPYSLLVLMSLLSCLAFVRLQRAGGWNGRICYVFVTAALLWTHLFSIFVV